MSHPDHAPGQINLERLMSRLAGGMPYDFGMGTDKELTVLLADLKTNFHRRLEVAKGAGSSHLGDLWLFAGHCIQRGAPCITFNYDDVYDQALWDFFPRHQSPHAWSPDWGYGFPCLMFPAVEEIEQMSGCIFFKYNEKAPAGERNMLCNSVGVLRTVRTH